jgi:hypothetical protein
MWSVGLVVSLNEVQPVRALTRGHRATRQWHERACGLPPIIGSVGMATSIEPFVDEGFGKYDGTNKAELPNTLPGGHEWEIALVVQGFLVKQPPAGALS